MSDPISLREQDLIQENIVRHDCVAAVRGTGSYDFRHTEIFNRHEQQRLRRALLKAWKQRRTDNEWAMDFGCGTGNLSEKLVALGATVLAADVSRGMLELVAEKLPFAQRRGHLSTHLLTGELPLPFASGSFGFVAMYSVLHHIPDYLATIQELARIVAPGGVIFIDHEALEHCYDKQRPLGLRIHRNLHLPRMGIPAMMRRIISRRNPTGADTEPTKNNDLPAEGDIHVYGDDHIQWKQIQTILEDSGFTGSTLTPYLACTETSSLPWRYWACRPFVTNAGLYVGIKA